MKKLDIKKIDSLYYYENNDLGYELKGKQHVFKVWSPIADAMYLCIYDGYDDIEGKSILWKKVIKGYGK